jgi:hypothetical protein
MSSSRAAKSQRTRLRGPLAALRRGADFRLAAGVVREFDETGRAIVEIDGGPGRSVETSCLDIEGARNFGVGDPVLLVVRDDGTLILLGPLRAPSSKSGAAGARPDRSSRDVRMDGRRLVFEAQQEVTLRCGSSSIHLRRDGRVLIRGAHVVSRSSGPNKLKGGSISLN